MKLKIIGYYLNNQLEIRIKKKTRYTWQEKDITKAVNVKMQQLIFINLIHFKTFTL